MKLEEKEKILENAYIPKELWDDCFITKDGRIFSPEIDRNTGVKLNTGEQCYNLLLERQQKPQEPQKALEQQLEESNKRVVCLEAAMAELAKQVAENTLLK